jgi:hypothetical protein
MRRSRRLLAVTLVVVVAAGVTVAAVKAARIRRAATQVADDIEHQLQELDPVTRAAVVGKLSTDAVKDIRSRH